jgi:hypothetical protein
VTPRPRALPWTVLTRGFAPLSPLKRRFLMRSPWVRYKELLLNRQLKLMKFVDQISSSEKKYIQTLLSIKQLSVIASLAVEFVAFFKDGVGSGERKKFFELPVAFFFDGLDFVHFHRKRESFFILNPSRLRKIMTLRT